MAEEENHDVFAEESTDTTSEAETITEEVEGGSKQEAETQIVESAGTKESKQEGEGTTAEPPTAEDSAVSKAEKMIPESRFKAALSDVNKTLAETRRELAAMKQQPTPDRTKDPEGYDRNYRINMSRDVVSRVYKDYDEKIAHFQEMAKLEPSLNTIVGNNVSPAQMAYDLAAKDMEIRELSTMKDSDEYKEFLAYKVSKQAASSDTATKLGGKTAASKVPNLNRTATNSNPNRKAESSEDDGLWSDKSSAW